MSTLSFIFYSLCCIIISCSEENVGYFWHITDAHIDKAYKAGSNADCGSVLCCREKTANQTKSAGEWGTFGYCDIPVKTFQSALDFVKEYPVTPDFIFYGGDSVVHQEWDISEEFVVDYIRTVATLFRDTFGSDKKFTNTRIIPAIGNHDTFPIDQMDVPPKYGWVFGNFTAAYGQWMTVDAKVQLSTSGFFDILLRPGLRAVVLNTQYADPINFYNYRNLTDPANHLAWLEKVLQNSQTANEKVLIFGHIPPGILDRSPLPSTIPSFTTKFQSIVNKYANIIIAQLYGHTHKDSFRLFREPVSKNVTSVAFIAPAATSWNIQHPSVRLFKYDTKTMQLLDMLTFYANLTEANIVNKMTWRLEYSAIEAYGIKDFTPTSWQGVVHRMEVDINTWLKFENFFHVLNYVQCPSGDRKCRMQQVCSISHQNYDEYYKCYSTAK